jgi:NADP-dependent 3-hydroxy acid dehydrogenase YdfG
LLDKGFRVFGSVRKQADAERLKAEFGANFTALMFDITDEAAVLAGAREVRAALNGKRLSGLVNNAGNAVSGPETNICIALRPALTSACSTRPPARSATAPARNHSPHDFAP